jgi:hypothetical protein
MAAVTVVKARPVSPPGYEVNDKGQAAVDLTAGTLVNITTATPGLGYEKVWDKAAANAATNAHGIVLQDCKAGATAEIGIQGEMDGFSGLTPGSELYPSATVAGGIDTTANTAGAPASRIYAVTASRIRYSFV